ncbi:MAG: Do family serine endopeptidase [Polyangiales bacterium]
MLMKSAYWACLLVLCACSERAQEVQPKEAPAAPPTRVDDDKPPTKTPTVAATDFRYQFVAAAKAIGPAVVSVNSVSVVKSHSPLEGTPLEFFFRNRPDNNAGQLKRGIGSGVIIDAAGHVLTNNHVVEGADKVRVVLASGHELNAKVVGTDPKSDLAVIKIAAEKDKLQAAELGDSEQLQVGEWVMAAGSPFGLRQTVSAGIVSAIGRGNVGISEYEDFIQTDAAINPGNSGGPLVDLTGRVIGISTAIASQSGGNNGVGFAIPIAMAKIVMDQLIRHGKVVRGYVGLYIGDVSQELAQSFGWKHDGGALVQDVTPNAPGARAGIQPGDIVFERDGHGVTSASAFRNGIAATPPGTTTTLKIWRDGKEQTLQLKLAELPTSGEGSSARPGSPPEHARWGLSLSEATPDARRRLGLDDAAQGAVIQQVLPESAADTAGLKAGDLITHIGNREVRSAADAQKALADEKGPVRVRVLRDGHGSFVIMSAQ